MSDLAQKVQQIKPAEKFRFGPWLPDLPDLDNPGLTEADNVLWSGGAYLPYPPLVITGFQVPGGTALHAIRAVSTTDPILFVASTDGVHNFISGAVGNSFNLVNLTGPGLSYESTVTFAQYGSTVFYADGVNSPQYNGVTTGTQFAKLTGPYGDAPMGQIVGVIGQFVLLGNIPNGPTSVQWSGINAPFNWPTPGSADAIAQQAGIQFLDYTLGEIWGISQGDQWGLILHYNGITRVQYVGGDVVFQFDTIYRGPTLATPHSWVKLGGLIYLCSTDGFLMTDGVNVNRIGNSQVDRWFQDNFTRPTVNVASTYNIACGVDTQSKNILWSFALLGTGQVNNAWIAYNYIEKRWTHGIDGIACYVQESELLEAVTGYGMQAFSSAANTQGAGFGGALTGTPGTAVLATSEIELNPGGRALLQGFRPQVTGLAGGSMTVRIGSRSRLGDQITYTPALQLNGQTNFADALIDANYHRAEVTLNGNFAQAIGGEFKAEPSGEW